MRLAEPYFLLLILFIPLVIFWGRRTGGKIRFSSISNLKKIKHPATINPRLILLALRTLALVLIVFALARPQAGKKYSEVSSEGVDIFLALDTSGSMQALDFKIGGSPVPRVEVVKQVASDFIKKRPSDRMGLVVFGEEAFTQCPLTLDHGILLDFLKQLEIGMAGDSTAIGSAIAVGVNRMKDLKAKSKVIVLVTDGRSNTGQITPLKAAELAAKFGVKVYTIGVGTRGEAPFLVNTVFGKRYVYQRVDLDEETLSQIADTTGAKFYRATDTDELVKIYGEIDKLERSEAKVKEYTEYKELFHYLLLAALALIVLEIGLGNTRLRIIP